MYAHLDGQIKQSFFAKFNTVYSKFLPLYPDLSSFY